MRACECSCACMRVRGRTVLLVALTMAVIISIKTNKEKGMNTSRGSHNTFLIPYSVSARVCGKCSNSLIFLMWGHIYLH